MNQHPAGTPRPQHFHLTSNVADGPTRAGGNLLGGDIQVHKMMSLIGREDDC